MTRTEEFLSVLQPVGPEFLSRFSNDDHSLSHTQSIDQVLKSQSMPCHRQDCPLLHCGNIRARSRSSLPSLCSQFTPELAGSLELAVVRVHLHCSARRGCLSGPGRVPAEDRRLAAEEGSYSLKTWLRKTLSPRLGELQYWAPASPVVSPLLSYLVLHWTGMVGRFPWIL